MDAAKIRLSAEEQELVSNAALILTKNRILEKVKGLLGDLQLSYQDHLLHYSAILPDRVKASSAKISRGENYRGMPWLVLDYPRFFSPESICAIRTLFWWGNFFSITLHLSGEPKKTAEKKLIAAFPLLKESGFSYCVNEDPWEHHFEDSNYAPLSRLSSTEFENQVRGKPFIKIANTVPLAQWEAAPDRLLEYFKKLLSALEDVNG